jgi:excisionase family DNA binding protein
MSICSTGLSDWEFAPLVVKPKAACRMLGCGNTRLYELLNAGDLESYRDGRARKITTASIRGYVAKRLALAHKTDEEPERPLCTSVDHATAASLAARRQRKTRRKRDQ